MRLTLELDSMLFSVISAFSEESLKNSSAVTVKFKFLKKEIHFACILLKKGTTSC